MSVPWACLLPAPHVLPPWAGTRWSRGLFLSHLRRHEMQGNTWHSTTIWQGALLWPYVSLPNLDRQGNIFTFKNQFLNVCACVYKHSKFLLDTEMWGFSGSKRKFLPLEWRLGADHLLRSEHVLCLAFSSKMLGPVCHSVLRESFGFQVANLGCRCCVPRHKGWDKMTEKEQRFIYAHGSTGWESNHTAPASDWFLVGTSYCFKWQHQQGEQACIQKWSTGQPRQLMVEGAEPGTLNNDRLTLLTQTKMLICSQDLSLSFNTTSQYTPVSSIPPPHTVHMSYCGDKPHPSACDGTRLSFSAG